MENLAMTDFWVINKFLLNKRARIAITGNNGIFCALPILTVSTITRQHVFLQRILNHALENLPRETNVEHSSESYPIYVLIDF